MTQTIIRPKKPLSAFDNVPDLQQMRLNAIKRNDHDYAVQIENRIAEINKETSLDIDNSFLSLIIAYEKILEEKKDKKTRANRTRNKWAKDGTIKTVCDLVKKKSSMGFSILQGVKELRYSLEQFVIDYSMHFDKEIVMIAKSKLATAR